MLQYTVLSINIRHFQTLHKKSPLEYFASLLKIKMFTISEMIVGCCRQYSLDEKSFTL